MTKPRAPAALLLIAPGCAHCPALMDSLCELLKHGALSALEIIDITAHPEKAEAFGVRGVPWTRIGEIELSGAYSPAELAAWAARAADAQGYAEHLAELLEQGQLEQVIGLIRDKPARLSALTDLLASLDTPLAVRVGIGAVLEEFAHQPALQTAVPRLLEQLRAPQPQVRADACHYLGLSGDDSLLPVVLALLADSDVEVREIAAETVEALSGGNAPKH